MYFAKTHLNACCTKIRTAEVEVENIVAPINHKAQTFAAHCSIVVPACWAIAAHMTAQLVLAFAFGVATAVIARALVHV